MKVVAPGSAQRNSTRVVDRNVRSPGPPAPSVRSRVMSYEVTSSSRARSAASTWVRLRVPATAVLSIPSRVPGESSRSPCRPCDGRPTGVGLSVPGAILPAVAIVYYTASSVDGFIADPEHSLSWLLSRDIDVEGPMHYSRFVESVGALAMGATTYRWIVRHEIEEGGRSWPYTVPTWVFTHRDLPVVADGIRLARGPVA